MEIMNNWNQFLTAQGARPPATDGALLHDFGQSLTVPQLQEGFVAAITDQGLIGLNGDDAASFLHGQLTNDVEHLNQEQVRLAGYCTPKGRLLLRVIAMCFDRYLPATPAPDAPDAPRFSRTV